MAKEKKEKAPKAPKAEGAGGKGLNMDVNLDFLKDLGKKKSGSGLPNKKTMNLVILEKSDNSQVTNIVLIVLLVIVLVVFAKFGVLDIYNEKKAAQEEADKAQAQLNEDKEMLEEFEKVFTHFSHYYRAFLSEEELQIVDRIELVKMLDENLFNVAEMQSITVKGNTVSVSFYDVTAEEAGRLYTALNEQPMVKSVFLETATTNKDKENKILPNGEQVLTANITIEVENPQPEDEAADENVDEEASE